MKTIVYTKYGPPDVLHLREAEKPMPESNEIQVSVRATAVNSGDIRLRKADPFAVRFIFGLRKPKINVLGSVYSGVVTEIGKNVTHFKVGDEVFGHTDMHFGAYAEFICLPEDGTVALKPNVISHIDAAVIPFGALTALHFLKKAKIKPGQKVLIYGASGAVGTAAVQLAKYYGAIVTGVCGTNNVSLVRSLGTDFVIDYSKEDFTKNGKLYDVIFDTVNKIPFTKILKSLNRSGIIILSAAEMTEMIKGAWTSITSRRYVLMGVISHTKEDLNFLKQLVESGQFKPVIDRAYTLAEMAVAHAYVEKGHKKGNVAIALTET